MTYPFDQISALGKANGQLVVALAQIARESGQSYVEIGGKATTAVFDQFKELKPGTVPNLKSEPVMAFLGEIKSRWEESAAQIKLAFEEWQEGCRDLLSQAADGQQAFVQSLAVMFQPSAQTPTEPDKASTDSAPVPPAPVKLGEAT
ncbi:hypothetical protein M527_04565 [Sphingobium indicum IP26]|uniref:Phasin domain-containing protein n=1 Tax=Sphingobium indicum F2 TaxID=1450518 RepID=A0A8E0WVA4_9SPHN|nr:hypothetical protein [Sphingobium indicum]EPR10990.1 hypothetical protein M527_02680 [Sphingobium indicum IP26]EPR11360.1 hypothetical protein M527_04565 [Sphingobium indicum IP26]KER38132.1 hypothetical protein AL00_02040 [Sphingobium indicum F2]